MKKNKEEEQKTKQRLDVFTLVKSFNSSTCLILLNFTCKNKYDRCLKKCSNGKFGGFFHIFSRVVVDLRTMMNFHCSLVTY
ncbi:hypothetical protein ERO13_D01G208100v2 [Gossypium hirsutum]|nr:hypothetical protein ERO13_D01G208100v2 [Gossypium hirsutum]